MLDYYIASFDVPALFKISKFYTINSSDYNSGDRYCGESHDFWECSYIQNGQITNSVNGKVYHLKKGDIIFYKPLEFHHYYVENGKTGENFGKDSRII